MTQTDDHPIENTINRSFRPNDLDYELIDILRTGRANPQLFADRTDHSKQYINKRLNSLLTAGWVHRPVKGLYALRYDPDTEQIVTGYHPTYKDD